MKKLWNSIGTVLLICFCCFICISHLANKFFQQDLGVLVFNEIQLDEQITSFFQEIEEIAPDIDRDALTNLKNEIVNNQMANQILGEATQDMLDDIVNTKETNQDMKETLKAFLNSYDDELEMVLSPQVSKDQLKAYMDKTIDKLPVQFVYDTAVESFKSSIPETYMKVMKIVNLVSKEFVFIGSFVGGVLTAIFLVFFNRKEMRWAFPIGTALVLSGMMMLVVGKVVPVVYQEMIQNLGRAISTLSEADFQLITIYGISYFVIGAICYGLHFSFNKRR